MKLALGAILGSWIAAASFAFRHQAEFGPYWRPGKEKSGRLMKGMLFSMGCFLVSLLVFFLLRRQVYGP